MPELANLEQLPTNGSYFNISDCMLFKNLPTLLGHNNPVVTGERSRNHLYPEDGRQGQTQGGDIHHSIANACACVGFGPLESRRAWILGFIYSSSSQFMDSSFRICIPHARTYDKEAVFFVIVTCMRNTNSDSRVSYNSNNLASGLCFRVGAGRGLP